MKYNLANTPTSVTSKFETILKNGQLAGCQSANAVVELCKKIFADAKLDTAWTRHFIAKISTMNSVKSAQRYVTNSYLSGTGNAVIS